MGLVILVLLGLLAAGGLFATAWVQRSKRANYKQRVREARAAFDADPRAGRRGFDEKYDVDGNAPHPGPVGFFLGGVAIVVGVLILLASQMFVVVGGTEVAVPVRVGRPGAPLDRGPHIVAPWTNVEKFSTTFQVRDLEFPVEGSDGGTMAATVKVRYRITLTRDEQSTEEACSVKDLFQFVRSEDRLEALIVDGDVREQVRKAFRAKTAFEGYTDQQTNITAAAAAAIGTKWEDKCVDLDTLTVTSLIPSPTVQAAIDSALAARQNVDKAVQERLARQEAANAAAYEKTAAAKAELDASNDLAAANRALDESLTPEVLQRLLILAIRDTANKIIFLPHDTDLTLTQDGQGATPSAGS